MIENIFNEPLHLWNTFVAVNIFAGLFVKHIFLEYFIHIKFTAVCSNGEL